MSAPAPWITRQLGELVPRSGHAWLIHGPSGLGQYEIGLELARAWLCAAATPRGACGVCSSCHQVDARVHPDLFVLLPETLALEKGWPLDEKTQEDPDSKKRKPSREIKVDAARAMVSFSQITRSGGTCKVVLIYPAERMNQVTANTLLKTLEEPPGESRFILCSEGADLLLATLRSRCQQYALRWPGQEEALAWLVEQGMEPSEAAALLGVAGGRPDLALRYAADGRLAASWRELPQALARGQTGVFADWPLAEVVEALQKLCHDQMAVKVGAKPRFFPSSAVKEAGSMQALQQWSKELLDSARVVEHPLNPGLMLETLVWQARNALNSTH